MSDAIGRTEVEVVEVSRTMLDLTDDWSNNIFIYL